MGEVRVPADAKWGAQTHRAVENFPISGMRKERSLIQALALIKGAAATVNGRQKTIEKDVNEGVSGNQDSTLLKTAGVNELDGSMYLRLGGYLGSRFSPGTISDRARKSACVVVPMVVPRYERSMATPMETESRPSGANCPSTTVEKLPSSLASRAAAVSVTRNRTSSFGCTASTETGT